MVIVRVDDIRKMRKEERSKKIAELKTELSRLMTMRAMGGSMENPARIRLIRKAIAKFKTISREEELGIRRQPAEKKAKEKESETPKGKAEKEKPKKEKKVPKKAKKEPAAEEVAVEEEED